MQTETHPCCYRSFENGITSPTAWNKDQYYSGDTTQFDWQSGIGRNNSKGVSVSSTEPNLAGMTQQTNIDPEVKAYNISGYIKGVDISGGAGAHLCIEGTWDRSDGFHATFDWTKTTFTFLTDGVQSPKIGCRLGNWYGDSTGQAWFDDIRLEDVFEIWSTPHINVYLESSDAVIMTTSTRDRWMSHLDAAYESLLDLTGYSPFEGEKIKILLYYAISMPNGKVGLKDGYYTGSQMKRGYLAQYEYVYDRYKKTGSLDGFSDCITCRFVDLAETLGWPSVKATFRDIAAMDPEQVPSDRLAKFNLFLDTWSQNAGVPYVVIYRPTNWNDLSCSLAAQINYIGCGKETPLTIFHARFR